MQRKHTGRKDRPDLSESVHEDDGVDPRTYFDRRTKTQGQSHRLAMLCQQVQEALQAGLAGATREEALDLIEGLLVQPAPDASRLRVEVLVGGADDIAPVQAALGRAKGWLRSAVAAAIHRKRCPELEFVVAEDRS